MPPLCTAGYGIAHLDGVFFWGGFYLFILNAIFIALPAYFYSIIMKFPKVGFENQIKERRYKRYVIITVAVIVMPSIGVFIGVVKDSVFNSDAEKFIKSVVHFEGSNMIEYNADREQNRLEVFMLGENVPEIIQGEWKKRLKYYNLDGTELVVSQASNKAMAEEHLSVDFIEQMYKDKDIQLHQKDDKIKLLESELSKFDKKKPVPLLDIEKEIEINYNKIKKLSYNESMELKFDGTVDTIPTFIVEWEEGYERVEEDSEKLVKWLELRLDIKSPRIVNH